METGVCTQGRFLGPRGIGILASGKERGGGRCCHAGDQAPCPPNPLSSRVTGPWAPPEALTSRVPEPSRRPLSQHPGARPPAPDPLAAPAALSALDPYFPLPPPPASLLPGGGHRPVVPHPGVPEPLPHPSWILIVRRAAGTSALGAAGCVLLLPQMPRLQARACFLFYFF